MSDSKEPTLVAHSHEWNTTLTVTAFCTITLYNFFELNVIVFNTFKRRSGLYFWSFLIATNGLMPYALGFLMMDLQLVDSYIIYITFIVVGWVCTVTGQSVVLYSRLHLVVMNKTKLKLVLAMIICNAFICHLPTTVLVYGANSPNPDKWKQPYNIYEKVEVTLFFIQELVLSGLYILNSVDFFRLKASLRGTDGLMFHLVWINMLIIILDVTILGLEYAGYYQLQTAYKGLVYSIKLKLEFRILNGLIDSTDRGRAGYAHHSSSGGRTGTDPDRTAVGLETLASSRKDNKHPVGSYSAQVLGGGRAGAAASASGRGGEGRDPGITITTTTEVERTSARRASETENSISSADDDDDNPFRAKPPGVDSGGRGARNPTSSTSSEIEFAKGTDV